MSDWKIRLTHERDCRDALVACGNPAPKAPDPDGGLFPVEARVFKGDVFFDFIEARGHDNAAFRECKCRR